MEIEVRTLQIPKNSWAFESCQIYQKKIAYFNKNEFKILKTEKDFLKGINSKDLVIICDEKGESLDSRNFAKKVNGLLESGKQKAFFIIGGPFGLPAEVKIRANFSLSLSPLVFNQELALVVLMEQIFRSFTIINNHPYHND